MSNEQLVAGWLRDAARIVVLTGAGVSTDSGIPDFRGPQPNPTTATGRSSSSSAAAACSPS
jgi:NAD-dependent SIR2 family protein deacetylase